MLHPERSLRLKTVTDAGFGQRCAWAAPGRLPASGADGRRRRAGSDCFRRRTAPTPRAADGAGSCTLPGIGEQQRRAGGIRWASGAPARPPLRHHARARSTSTSPKAMTRAAPRRRALAAAAGRARGPAVRRHRRAWSGSRRRRHRAPRSCRVSCERADRIRIGTSDQPRRSRMKSTPLPVGQAEIENRPDRACAARLRSGPAATVSASNTRQPSSSSAARTKRRICFSSSISTDIDAGEIVIVALLLQRGRRAERQGEA